jgi:hypothetical protein
LQTAQKAVLELYETYSVQILASGGKPPKSLNKVVAGALRSRHTEFVSPGSVEVEMEIDLPAVLVAAGFSFKEGASGDSDKPDFTGLVLRNKNPVPRTPVFKVVDETGRVLYSVGSVLRQSFKKRLMGRWYQSPTRKELAAAVGSKPVSLGFELNSAGDFLVKGAKWQEALARSANILELGQVVVVAPL